MKKMFFLLLIATVGMFASCAKKDVASKTPEPTNDAANKEEAEKKASQYAVQPYDKPKLEAKEKTLPNAADKGLLQSGLNKHNSGDYTGAINDFSQLINQDPSNSEAYLSRGMSKVKSGDKAGGCEDIKMAQKLGNTYAGQTLDVLCK
ncbi:MAG: hypothetical protein SFW35_10895 [Chitinophagales bacterium]|nr:hypothetical protein [Chitinophagales bacterium]